MKKTILQLVTIIMALGILMTTNILNTTLTIEMASAEGASIKPTTKPVPAPSTKDKKTPSDEKKTDTTIRDLQDHQFDLNLLSTKDENKSYLKEKNPIISFILKTIVFLTKIIGTLAMLILIIGGFQLMVSQGDETGLENGKNTIKYAIIGLVITFLSYIIVTSIQSVFTTNDMNNANTPDQQNSNEHTNSDKTPTETT